MKYIRRLLMYLSSRLFVLVLIVSLCVVSFYYAMNVTNMQIILKDGMAKRAQVVMGMTDVSELSSYFQSVYLGSDPAIQTALNGESAYRDYNIRGIDHRIEMGFVWVWPWDETCRVQIVERIPRIDGRIKGDRAEEAVAVYGQSAVYPPAWQSARYSVTMVRESGQWHIKALVMQEILED